jgi:hypothetical protein
MKRVLRTCFLIASFFLAQILLAGDAETLAGKWSVNHVTPQWQTTSQTIEVKGTKFIFEALDKDRQAVVHAEGDIKFEKLGPFSLVRFVHVRAGESASNMDNVDDEFNCIYTIDGNTWTLANNFDKDRDTGPNLDAYKRVPSQAKTLVIDDIEMADTPQSGTWYLCFEANVEGVSRRHYIENKGYEKNEVKIPLALEIPRVKPGQKCSFKLQLDDVDGDACTEDVDNRSTGQFAVSESGSQIYKPQHDWRYTIHWHLK